MLGIPESVVPVLYLGTIACFAGMFVGGLVIAILAGVAAERRAHEEDR
jgi:hypothetical protein